MVSASYATRYAGGGMRPRPSQDPACSKLCGAARMWPRGPAAPATAVPSGAVTVTINRSVGSRSRAQSRGRVSVGCSRETAATRHCHRHFPPATGDVGKQRLSRHSRPRSPDRCGSRSPPTRARRRSIPRWAPQSTASSPRSSMSHHRPATSHRHRIHMLRPTAQVRPPAPPSCVPLICAPCGVGRRRTHLRFRRPPVWLA